MSFKSFFTKTPVQIASAVVAGLNLLVLTHVVTWSADAISAANIFIVLLLGLFVSNTTTNTAALNELQTHLTAQGVSPVAPVTELATAKRK